MPKVKPLIELFRYALPWTGAAVLALAALIPVAVLSSDEDASPAEVAAVNTEVGSALELPAAAPLATMERRTMRLHAPAPVTVVMRHDVEAFAPPFMTQLTSSLVASMGPAIDPVVNPTPAPVSRVQPAELTPEEVEALALVDAMIESSIHRGRVETDTWRIGGTPPSPRGFRFR